MVEEEEDNEEKEEGEEKREGEKIFLGFLA